MKLTKICCECEKQFKEGKIEEGTKHPGGYLLGQHIYHKKRYRCSESDRYRDFEVFDKSDKRFYDKNGLLLPEFWSLPRTESASKLVFCENKK